jgi:hypothetical protein
MSIFIHSSGETKSVMNGNVMDDKSFDATYNGKNMKIIGHDKDKSFNIQMTNAEIMKLLARPSSNLTLKQRLMSDYNVTTSKSTNKSIKSKSIKSKSIKSKSIKRKSIKRKSIKRKSIKRKSIKGKKH